MSRPRPAPDHIQDHIQAQFSAIFTDKFSGGVTPGVLNEVLAEAYAFFTGACEDIYQKTPEQGRPDCQAGCDHCCHQFSFQATAPEICYLVENLSKTLDENEMSALKTAVSGFLKARRDAPEQIRDQYRFACPFLKNESCMAYDLRPFVCRGFNSFDKSACMKKRFDTEQDPHIPVHRAQVDLSRGMAGGLRHALIKTGKNVDVLDFVAALDIALSDDQACKRWFSGESPFVAADFEKIVG